MLKKNIKITVLPYDELYIYEPKNKSILIRLHLEENEDNSFEEKYVDVLKIDIIDEWNVNNKKYEGKLFTKEHNLEILNFVEKHIEEVEEIVIHCKAGLSRSPAVAISLLNLLDRREDALSYIHKHRAMPNRLIIEIMNDEKFFKDFVEEIKKRGLRVGYRDLIKKERREN